MVDKCRSSVLGRKFLEKGSDLTLGTLQTIARAHEAADSQVRSIESKNTQSVNLVRRADNPKPQQNSSDKPRQAKRACFRCGQTTHFARDKSCPARGKKCRLCEKYDHFAKCCKTKAVNKKPQSKPASGGKQHIKLVQESSESEFVFTCGYKTHRDDISVHMDIEGVEKVQVLVDSGATCNIIDCGLWEKLKIAGIKCRTRKAQKKLFAYGSKQPLDVIGDFSPCVNGSDDSSKQVDAEFVVIKGTGQALLGCKTAQELGLLHITKPCDVVNAVHGNDITEEFKDCFQGIGKLNDHSVKIHLDPNIKPVIQPLRRLPFSLRERLKQNWISYWKQTSFCMTQLIFMGHVLSAQGVSIEEAKVQAVKNARKPENAAEVRSFLGLVNFSAKFIPNLATISEPLRRLTRKSMPFSWQKEHSEAF